MENVGKEFESILQKLNENCPTIASSLQKAFDNRVDRLSSLHSGIRLKGLEALHIHLTKLEDTFQKHNELQKISFLMFRIRCDFEKALEAALSGFHSVAADAMRDVMEIEFLLRDFKYLPSHINEWLSANEKDRRNKFQPVVLRQRHAARLGNRAEDMVEATDYKGHSVFLHVTPFFFPYGGNGLYRGDDKLIADTCFWDIFEHARRIILVSHELLETIFPDAEYNPEPNELSEIKEAWERTQDMQTIFTALLLAAGLIDEDSES